MPPLRPKHDDRVLGNYREEMERREKLAEKANRKWWIQVLITLALLWYAIQPAGLDLLHQMAFLTGIYLIVNIPNNNVFQVADELDILERKIVAKFKDLEGKS